MSRTDGKEIFRKVSLERLSSPEQLDHALHVTTPKGWVGLLALFSVLAAALTWGILGSIETTVTGQGLVVRTGGVFNIVSLGSGRVTEAAARVGDAVRKGQVVATVAQPAMLDKLEAAREQLTNATSAHLLLKTAHAANDRLRLEALNQNRANIRQEIQDTQEQIKLVLEQIPVEESLLQKGLITKQTTLQTKQKLITMRSNIDKLTAQLKQADSDQAVMENQSKVEEQDGRRKIEEMRRNVEAVQRELDRASKVITPWDGRILEEKVYAGALVQAGSPLFNMEALVKHLAIAAYVPSGSAKEVSVGMAVQLSPAGMPSEEFGYVLGHVTSVAEFPVTMEALMRNFENESVARNFMGNGPVSELAVEFDRDAARPDTLKWSSRETPPGKVTSGTICSVRIVTRSQAPITMVLPILKKTLGLN